MKQLQKNQLRHRSKFSQLILLNDRSNIVSSCDSIFDTTSLRSTKVIDWFPFLESIYPTIWSLTEESGINFSKIETPIKELPGIYDFSFSKVQYDNNEVLILWSIYDYTDLYEDYKQFQQRKNELEIHREMLERRYQSLPDKNDLGNRQNIIIEHLDHLQLTYYNKIKAALLSPVNPLDGITFILSKALEKKNNTYVQQLRSTLDQLHYILEDLESLSNGQPANFHKQNFNLDTAIAEIATDLNDKFKPSNTFEYSIAEGTPNKFAGNLLYLKQIIVGTITNAKTLHPGASFVLEIGTAANNNNQQTPNNYQLSFQVTEFLDTKPVPLNSNDYTNMVYRLSIVKQLIDLQNGSIEVTKNTKNLSVNINFTLPFELEA